MNALAAPPLCLGLELNPTTFIAVLQDQHGQVVAQVQRSLPRSVSGEQDCFQDPQDWWRTLRTGVKDLLRRFEIDPSRVRGVGIVAPDHGPAAVGREMESLGQVALAGEGDFSAALEELVRLGGRRNVINICGREPIAASMGVHLLHLRNAFRRAWHDAALVLSPRDFLRLRLTEAVSTDASTACTSLLFNPRTRVWSKTILDLLDVPMERLPAILGGTAIGGRITKTAAVDSRLIEGTVVAVGGSRDLSIAAALGVVDPGQAMLDLLGEGRFILNTAKPSRNRPSQSVVGCHLLPNVWTIELPRVGVPEQLAHLLSTVTGRERNQWSRSGKNPVHGLATIATTVAAGAEGVRLDPQNPQGFLRLEAHHTRAHQARACFDSPGLAISTLLTDLDPEIARPTSLRVTGEGAKIPWWCQNIADATGLPVTHHDLPFPAAQGAALIAGVTAGIWPDLTKAAKSCLSTAATYRPRKDGLKAFAAALACERGALTSEPS